MTKAHGAVDDPCGYFDWAATAPPLDPETPCEGKWEDLVQWTKGHLSVLAGRDPRDVSLHHNTTGAFQRIATRLRLHFEGSSPVLLLTDQEYPGVVALLDEQWHGPIVMVQTAGGVWEGKPEEVRRRLLLAIRRFKPQVVLLSHVARTTGLMITDSWLTEVAASSPGSIIVLDGAQAMGNVHVTETALEIADFYVFSGHKWLRGQATLGIVISRQDIWSIDDPGQGYSVQAGSRGTGSEAVLGSIVGSFRSFPDLGTEAYAKDVAEKAQELARLLDQRSLPPVGLTGEAGSSWPWNGIVSVPLGDYGLSRTDERPKYTILDPELFRSADLGCVSAGPRYVVSFAGAGADGNGFGDATVERRASFCDVPVPCPPFGVARFCVSQEHSRKDLERLADTVQARCFPPAPGSQASGTGGGP
ncbi:MAG: aminotransferase class V-fold PLP-dependent enzyme [Thermoanaerobaculia bacterium]